MSYDQPTPPTLDELRRQVEHEREMNRRSRFHKTICPKCGEMVTNQAMGRRAHMAMHERTEKQPA